LVNSFDSDYIIMLECASKGILHFDKVKMLLIA